MAKGAAGSELMAEFPPAQSHLWGQSAPVSATSPGFWSLIPPFLRGSRSWGNVKGLCITSKGVQQKKTGLASGSPCWCRHRAWQLRGRKKDHSGQRITEGSGETAHCFKSNAVEQTSLPVCRAEALLITEAFLGSFVGLFVKHTCKVNMKKKKLVLPK